MLGFRAWGDDLNVVLFEFLEDDTKLAQSCTEWLFVQHWYTVPDPAMRVTLWALMGVGDDCDKRIQDTSPLDFSLTFLAFCGDWHNQCDCVGSTWFCLHLCCQKGPVFCVPPRHQISSHRRHGLGILCRSTTAGYVMLANTFVMTVHNVPASSVISGRVSFHIRCGGYRMMSIVS